MEVVTIKSASPRSNSLVERFMRTLEQYSLHQFPNTTGSNPSDPIRKNPEREAKRLKTGLDELELIVDMTIANYNAEPHTYFNGCSPIEYLRYRLMVDFMNVRYTSDTLRDRYDIKKCSSIF